MNVETMMASDHVESSLGCGNPRRASWRNPAKDVNMRIEGAKRIGNIIKKGAANHDERREYRVLVALEQLCYNNADSREEYTDPRLFEILLHRVASEKAKRRRETPAKKAGKMMTAVPEQKQPINIKPMALNHHVGLQRTNVLYPQHHAPEREVLLEPSFETSIPPGDVSPDPGFHEMLFHFLDMKDLGSGNQTPRNAGSSYNFDENHPCKRKLYNNDEFFLGGTLPLSPVQGWEAETKRPRQLM
mmetsp:Transcript_15929/g.25992  ORF Transcript_15929/g.25992 Transcript_15929/m.25992 type:complete len:245 (+) Transcript_15929:383-1117(+)|eukprot:CAMPEP_0203751002 /NCGR_PEP_ID=MMETSP0098-20131031/5138_1 /ASSEMBLY_ACC=CAM_ASM_000208 /TAXON_ID=96639 /ORGANISM=" , Strain NY0313808BC1" /LENGTH=244 /DNA_ID=CAMNT_0050640525 /DNA_START=350 /DNA_END=1084 /DNA_ORIENTATION=+